MHFIIEDANGVQYFKVKSYYGNFGYCSILTELFTYNLCNFLIANPEDQYKILGIIFLLENFKETWFWGDYVKANYDNDYLDELKDKRAIKKELLRIINGTDFKLIEVK